MSQQMTTQDFIYNATIALAKGYSYEEFMYSDYMYGHEDDIDNVWHFVNECEQIGEIAFKEKYKEYTLSPLF